jgi:hypothetical protein
MPITQQQSIERSQTMLVGRLLTDWVRYDKKVPEGFEGGLVDYARFIAAQSYTEDYDGLHNACPIFKPVCDDCIDSIDKNLVDWSDAGNRRGG